jgi:hypothetical protein
MSTSSSVLDPCHCCEGLRSPEPTSNDPGLPALRYRVDTQPGFYARMLQSLPLAPADPSDPGSRRPLAQLLSHSTDDPTVALIDACACMADVLTFYQERIANEGFLRTATERRSVLELARAIGYELKPGVAASVHLAFTVEDAPGAPRVCTLASGTAVQSVPPQRKLPQVFETSAELTAHAEWNALRPRQTRPADMAICADSNGVSRTLALLGPTDSFPSGTPNLHKDVPTASLFRLDPGLQADNEVDAIDVDRIYVSDTTTGIAGGDLLLFIGKSGDTLRKMILRVVAVVAEPMLKRIRIDLESLPDPTKPAPLPTRNWQVPYTTMTYATFAKARISSVAFTSSSLATNIAAKAWRESDLQAMIGIQGWDAGHLVKAIGTQMSGPPVAPEAGAFCFSARLGSFGHNAPKWAILPQYNTNAVAYPFGWDVGDVGADGTALTNPRRVWTDSQDNPLSPHVYVERPVPDVTPRGWTVFDAPEATATAYGVFDAREVSRADYGLSGRAMQITLADDKGQALVETNPPNFWFRSTTIYAGSRKLGLSDLPIDAPIAQGHATIELDSMVLGLTIGQPIALCGERDDLRGVNAAEIAFLADIVHANGRTTLSLQKGLNFSYRRSSLTINANVVHATHGETVREVLGNGDATVANQTFVLKKPPLTYLSVGSASGESSTLELRVNGVRWDEVPALFSAAPDQTAYEIRIDDDARARVTFGDNAHGARLPTGTVNVTSQYRSGIGLDGEVAASTLTMLRARPLGLRDVTNPVAASGAQGPQQFADAKRNAPLTLLTFQRVVSILDYQDFARGYPGIGKARADVLWIDGTPSVHLTVASATGGAPSDDVLAHLTESIRTGSDPSQRFNISAYAPRYFSVTADVAVDPRYVAHDVVVQAVTALQTAFGFAARELGQSVTAAEIITQIHRVAGVVAVDLRALVPYADGPPPQDLRPPGLPSFAARWDSATRTITPANLLLINPVAIRLTEAKP